MAKPKIYKRLAIFFLLFVVMGGVMYASLKTRHKAIVKTLLLHKLGLVDNEWLIDNGVQQYKMISPTFMIDGIYKSMEGPAASKYIQLSQDPGLLWITGFEVKALDAKTRHQVTNDFVCHTNIDINDVNYYTNFGLEDRIGKRYPRLTSLSHGLETFHFPKGYAVPIKGNDMLFVTTESLNHNLKDKTYWIKHEVTVEYTKKGEQLKPLMSRTAYVQLPYDKNDPYKGPTDHASNVCMPVETKNHSYDDGHGNMMSGHWVIPRGRKTYSSSINDHLQITDSLRLHAAAVHVHPFATLISVWDKTAHKTVFECKITNHKDSVGLSKIEDFVSEDGIWLYANHDYEMVLEVNNTSSDRQDMMGSMFLFFYDAELDAHLKSMKLR